MVITSVRLQNYRSYTDSSFEFEPGVNIIVGPNASGKTNLLDALHFIATGGSMKSTRDFMVRDTASWARVDSLNSNNQERIVKITEIGATPELHIDGKVYKRPPLEKKIPIVLFEPNHLYFITTSPEQRRSFIDDILLKTDKDFSRIKSNYLRTLQQRNSLLKLPMAQIKNQIFAWDVRLCELAGQYATKRRDIIKTINNDASGVYSAIANKEHKLELTYESKTISEPYASKLLTTLQKKLEIDHARGFTGYGPHRDDISIRIDDKDMRDVASRGETRSILLTLKVIESQILENVHGVKPLLLLDDVFGELDGVRRKSLIEFMSTNQTFITTTDADVITHSFVERAKIIPIQNLQ